jgi:hypothetical protein
MDDLREKEKINFKYWFGNKKNLFFTKNFLEKIND